MEQEQASERRQEIKQFISESLNKAGGGTKSKTSGTTSTTTTAAKPRKLNPAIELMKMKSNAKGESSIPSESRIYLRVTFPAESKRAPEAQFFHKDWVIGKLVDKIASSASILNVNNTGEKSQALQLYETESGALLPMNVSLDALIKAKQLPNGGSITLERLANMTTQVQ
ncbi:AN1-type zinc finger protein 1 [Blyttiomyces sp. JEL0837]|nr:AN1-type zinc finger protein 1 [Blyttiomyces sp. JEL0837]